MSLVAPVLNGQNALTFVHSTFPMDWITSLWCSQSSYSKCDHNTMPHSHAHSFTHIHTNSLKCDEMHKEHTVLHWTPQKDSVIFGNYVYSFNFHPVRFGCLLKLTVHHLTTKTMPNSQITCTDIIQFDSGWCGILYISNSFEFDCMPLCVCETVLTCNTKPFTISIKILANEKTWFSKFDV